VLANSQRRGRGPALHEAPRDAIRAARGAELGRALAAPAVLVASDPCNSAPVSSGSLAAHGGTGDIVTLMVTGAEERVSLAEAKAHLSEVVEGIETEHRRVVITKHGRPSVVVLAVEDLETLEETLDVLSDAAAIAELREAAEARRDGRSVELSKEEALARWSRG
jgi:antitoxin YefM